MISKEVDGKVGAAFNTHGCQMAQFEQKEIFTYGIIANSLSSSIAHFFFFVLKMV